jgi:Holliday junction DNA helicase RuvA
MIGTIKGTLTERFGNEGIVETSSGVGYTVFLPTIMLGVPLPHEVQLYTYLHVREDALVLYGFESRQKLELFHMLHAISGVGPKTAFTVGSFIDPESLRAALQANDLSYFTRIPGLGKKTAMKIILELSDRMKQNVSLERLNLSEEDETVIGALNALGFQNSDIRPILDKIDTDQPLEERIKQGIRLMTNKK